MLVVQAFLFFVSYSCFIHNKNFITSYVTICKISSNMILSFVFATNHLWNAACYLLPLLKGISCLQVIFLLNWMKQTLIWLNL